MVVNGFPKPYLVFLIIMTLKYSVMWKKEIFFKRTSSLNFVNF